MLYQTLFSFVYKSNVYMIEHNFINNWYADYLDSHYVNNLIFPCWKTVVEIFDCFPVISRYFTVIATTAINILAYFFLFFPLNYFLG